MYSSAVTAWPIYRVFLRFLWRSSWPGGLGVPDQWDKVSPILESLALHQLLPLEMIRDETEV